jgi:hypothetical protein
METQTKTSGGAKDFFINLGAIVALYTLIISLVNLLFTIINYAYPKITNGYDYLGSQSISWPVATLIIFFPIFILLMWLLEKQYKVEPEKKNSGIHKWLTYITLFISGLAIAIDLITVLYYFLDGQELTTGFLLKVLVLFVIATCVFVYYISDIRDRLTSKSRIVWRAVVGVIILGSIIWGFAVLGSPATQRLNKYDEQKVSDISSIDSAVQNFYSVKGILPKDFTELSTQNYYISTTIDSQTQKPYEYKKTGDLTYSLCAVFNKDTKNKNPKAATPMYNNFGSFSWVHSSGYYCFNQTINPNMYTKPMQIR